MKKIHILLLCVLGLTLDISLISCKEEKKPDMQDNLPHQLYGELRDLYKSYADSLAQLEDSALIDSMIIRLDYRVKKTYEKYPADLDTRISEAENDTLWKFVSKIAEKRHILPTVVEFDSIISDSLSNVLN